MLDLSFGEERRQRHVRDSCMQAREITHDGVDAIVKTSSRDAHPLATQRFGAEDHPVEQLAEIYLVAALGQRNRVRRMLGKAREEPIDAVHHAPTRRARACTAVGRCPAMTSGSWSK